MDSRFRSRAAVSFANRNTIRYVLGSERMLHPAPRSRDGVCMEPKAASYSSDPIPSSPPSREKRAESQQTFGSYSNAQLLTLTALRRRFSSAGTQSQMRPGTWTGDAE